MLLRRKSNRPVVAVLLFAAVLLLGPRQGLARELTAEGAIYLPARVFVFLWLRAVRVRICGATTAGR
jgi:hypothetical protein